jgi:3-oxoadipate enol-lactonase
MGGRTTDAVLLLHAGIADSRMWRVQVPALEAAGYRVIAPDFRGFGTRPLEPAAFSHLRDVEELVDCPLAVVGNSLGGRVALELALHRPELVERLVLIAPGLPGWEWSEATRTGWAEEEEAIERGDFEAAAEASVRMWVDGPNRSPGDVDAGIRADVTAMVLGSYKLQHAAWEAGAREEELLDAPVRSLLSEIHCPTLVLLGDNDVADMHAIADHVARAISGARLVTVRNAAHLPGLERPDEINALLIEFLGNS